MDFIYEPERIWHADEVGNMDAEIIVTDVPNRDLWSIDRTFVSESLRGQGVAGQLVDAAIDLAREKGMKVYASCEYSQRLFAKHPDEYKDVVVNVGQIDTDEDIIGK
jgi:predicted GNAT family acetyltransferase